MREKHVQKKGIVLMFISTQTLWNSESWKNAALPSLDLHVTFGCFSSCLLKIHSLSPSLHPSLHPILIRPPQSFVFVSFLILCRSVLSILVALKPLSGTYSQVFIFNSCLFTAMYIHLSGKYRFWMPYQNSPCLKLNFSFLTPLPSH